MKNNPDPLEHIQGCSALTILNFRMSYYITPFGPSTSLLRSYAQDERREEISR